ncbi:hypothetical protein ILFOPFJJ_06569 [Ensifer psoraleae]|uniref:hypothetical protein n=1 Tax=Sinorhizobium psoraleae TaxID=520838 RepID=UPI00156A2E7A|nr:hypothetical protein [Sinorhizobium psoraleae]NRP75646.1 hypothetical protein [Sinorhizobium psoraleae]
MLSAVGCLVGNELCPEVARWAAQKLLAAEPGFTIERYRALLLFQEIPQWADQMAEGLRQAGLPER